MKTSPHTQPMGLNSHENEIVNDLVQNHDDMVETLLTWSLQNSGSLNREGLAKMRELLRAKFSSLPGQITDVALSSQSIISKTGEEVMREFEPSLRLTTRPEAPVQLVLTGHYDTVFPKSSHFQSPTYLDDMIVNGPGVADMKGGILVMWQALQALERSPHKDNIGYTVLLSPDEEIGSPGSAAELNRLGVKADIGLTFEPALADGSMAGARKGSGNFSLIIRGKAAHAGREHHLGHNAINAMADFALRIEALNGQRDEVTFNLAKIDGGGANNIVPDLAIGRFNVRMKASEDMAWIEENIKKCMDAVKQREGITLHLHGGFSRPPKPMSEANAMVFNWVKQAGECLGQMIKWSPSGGVCEGNNLWAAGCPNVDTLGVRGGHIHSDQEFVDISSLVERAQLTTVILLKLASGEFDAKHAKQMAMSIVGKLSGAKSDHHKSDKAVS